METSLHSGLSTAPQDSGDSTLVDESVLARLTGFVETATPSVPASPPSESAAPLPFSGVSMPDPNEELGTPAIDPGLVQAMGGGSGSALEGGAIAGEGEERAGEEEEVVDPRSKKTRTTMSNSPLTRLGIVGGGVGALVMLSLIVWTTLSSGLHDKPSPKPSATASVAENGLPVADASSAALAASKSENALNGQRQLLTKINTKGAPKSQVKPSPKATPVAVVTPAPAPPAPVVDTAPAVTAPPAPVQAQDPFAQWQQAAMVGSFGQVSVARVTPTTPAPTVVTPPPASTLFAPTNPVRPASGPSGARSISQLRSAGDGSGLRSTPITPVLVGTTAGAELVTAIIMTSDNSSAVNPDDPNAIKYLAKLSQPIKDSKGADAIPAGAQLVLVASNFSPQSGTMAFQVKSVIVNNTEYTLPSGSVLVRGGDGALLALNKRGGKAGINLIGPIFAGLGQAATMINQPTSSSVITGGVSTTTTTSTGQPNYAAGFVSGLGTNLSQQIQQQAQITQQQAASNNSVSWQAGAGTRLQVVVNNTFEM